MDIKANWDQDLFDDQPTGADQQVPSREQQVAAAKPARPTLAGERLSVNPRTCPLHGGKRSGEDMRERGKRSLWAFAGCGCKVESTFYSQSFSGYFFQAS